MKPKWNGQADLFERRPTAVTPLPDMRVKLGTLLQLLLREAAGFSRGEGTSDGVVREVSHEQAHR